MSLCQVYRYGREDRYGWHPGWRISFEYDAEKVEALKATVPHACREWDSEKKEWWVAQEYEEAVLAVFPEFEAFLKQPRLFE